MKRKYKIYLTFLLTLFLTSCGEPNIENDCTLNGRGIASCDFRNTGKVKGDACFKAILVRTHKSYEDYRVKLDTDSVMKQIWLDPGVEWSDKIGSYIESQGKVCSGIVESKDIVQRSKDIRPFFFISDNNTKGGHDINMFCNLGNNRQSGEWYRGCSVVFERVEDN